MHAMVPEQYALTREWSRALPAVSRLFASSKGFHSPRRPLARTGGKPHSRSRNGMVCARPMRSSAVPQAPAAAVAVVAAAERLHQVRQHRPRLLQLRRRASRPAPRIVYLNVWTSANNPNDRRPVMVWIYGGGFTGGSGGLAWYDGENLAAKGPVIVTFNYRLGSLGFFSHPELAKESGHNAAGNYGMMDAIAALQWVKRNISAFGGDPNNVTIAGESAGAIMIGALVGSPQAKASSTAPLPRAVDGWG